MRADSARLRVYYFPYRPHSILRRQPPCSHNEDQGHQGLVTIRPSVCIVSHSEFTPAKKRKWGSRRGCAPVSGQSQRAMDSQEPMGKVPCGKCLHSTRLFINSRAQDRPTAREFNAQGGPLQRFQCTGRPSS